MSKNQPQQKLLRKKTEEEMYQDVFSTDDNLTDLLRGMYPQTRSVKTILEVYQMVKQTSSTVEENAKQQLRLISCLYAVLGVFISASATAAAVLYAVGMTQIGLGFIGPVITGILAFLVAWLCVRKK